MSLTPDEVRGCERIAAILRETAPERRAEMLQRAIELARAPRGTRPPNPSPVVVDDAETKPLRGRITPPEATSERTRAVTAKLQVPPGKKLP
ncbi:MAG: hypothetical protein R3B06_15055 [Kofleriaceae bacterium]